MAGIGLHSAPLVLQLVSFALLLIATITVPATNVLSLAEQDNYRFGVLGYCQQHGGAWSCSKAAASYDPTAFGNADDWVFSTSARQTLAKIIILIPVACFVALVTFVLAVVSHLPGVYSNVFLIVELVVTVIAFLLAALVCVVDFLLFYPHVTYGSWILIPAAVWPLLSIIFIVMALVLQSGDAASVADSDEEDNHITIGKVDHFDSNFSAFNNNNTSVLPPPIDDEKKHEAYKTTTKSVNDDSYFENKSNVHENVAPTDFTNNFLPPVPNQNFNSSSYSGLTTGRNDSFATANSQPLAAQQSQSYNQQGQGYGYTPYPTGDEFNFTPVPQSGFQDVPSNNNNPYEAGHASQASNNHPYAARRMSNQGAPKRVPTGQTAALQSRMPSSVYPETVTTTNQSPARAQNYYMEDDGYYGTNAAPNRYEEDLENIDSSSDFTSVSQRPANPLYYQNLANQPPANSYGAPANNYGGPAAYGAPGGSYNAYSGKIQQPNAGYTQAPPPKRQEGPSKSDILLNSNPEFSLGGAGRPKPGFKRPTGRGPPGSGGGYKRPGQNKPITAASLSRDSPYNLRL